MANSLSRRDFLKQTAAVAGGALIVANLPEQLHAQSAPNRIPGKPRVVVVGAGFAGLAAAYALRQKGLEVQVVEARNRIGGRVFTQNIDSNLTVELGAEWVGASHERIIALCKDFGLTLDDHRFNTHLIYQGKYATPDQWDYSPEWNAVWDKLTKKYESLTDADKARIDKMDWWRYLVNNGATGRDLDIRELLDSTDFGESIRHVSGFAALAEYMESSEKNEMDFHIQGGNSKLAEALADRIGRERIHIGQRVGSITQTKTSTTVIALDAAGKTQRYECDRVICAVPTYALSKIAWMPLLPASYLEALNSLQFARIAKVITLYRERFWKAEDFDMATDQYGHYFYHPTKNQVGPKGALTGYICGDKAEVISLQDEAFRRKVIAETLAPAFGDTTRFAETQLTYYWGKDEYSMGSYALYGKGQWPSTMNALKRPHQNVWFAGEHLADWQGFMEGAINSGEEAAEAMLA